MVGGSAKIWCISTLAVNEKYTFSFHPYDCKILTKSIRNGSWTVWIKKWQSLYAWWEMFLASTMHTRIAFVASCIGLYDHYATLTARQLFVQRSSDHFCVCDDQSKCLCKVHLVSNQTQKDGVLLTSAISTMVYEVVSALSWLTTSWKLHFFDVPMDVRYWSTGKSTN